MEAKEISKKIRRIEITSNKLVDELFSGEYRSGFRGKGMEFDHIRQYTPGDDVRSIDWKVTARYDKAFVKQYVEEREMNLFLLIDMSRSNSFGKKMEVIAELSATLALSAIRNNDRVGAILFTDDVEQYIPSKHGRRHVLSIIERILSAEPMQSGTNIAKVLQYFNRREKKRSVVFLLSDFLDEGYENALKATGSRHDLICVRVIDRAEERIPAGAIFRFTDMETGQTFVLDNLKQDYTMPPVNSADQRNLITIYTDEDYVLPLKHFFRRRLGL